MGGMIAMEFALRHPGRLDRMILTGAPGAPARAAFHPVMSWNWGICPVLASPVASL
jgi:pimeloyl-ACP methyl ester carboxylesterase